MNFRLRSFSSLIGYPLIFGAVVLSLVGCGNETTNNLFRTIDIYRNGLQGPSITREQVDAIPYASMGLQIGKGPLSLVVLGRVAGDKLHWISADRNAFVTQRGRLVATAGLTTNLQHTEIKDDPLLDAPRLMLLSSKEGISYRKSLDWQPDNVYSVTLDAVLQYVGDEDLQLLGNTIPTRHFIEKNNNNYLNWQFTNEYWVSYATGEVVKAIEYIHPELPVFKHSVYKPYRA